MELQCLPEVERMHACIWHLNNSVFHLMASLVTFIGCTLCSTTNVIGSGLQNQLKVINKCVYIHKQHAIKYQRYCAIYYNDLDTSTSPLL